MNFFLSQSIKLFFFHLNGVLLYEQISILRWLITPINCNYIFVKCDADSAARILMFSEASICSQARITGE